MQSELRMTKTLLEVPKLRENLKNHDFKDLDFKGFLTEVNKLAHDVKGQLIKEGCLLPDQEFKKMKEARDGLEQEKTKERYQEYQHRKRFKLNQNMNMTSSTVMAAVNRDEEEDFS